jgi:hypothetical protein
MEHRIVISIKDDDIRNIFALISALERHQIQAVYAENGRNGIKMLKETAGIDVVLMDIMMPEIGYKRPTHAFTGKKQARDLKVNPC